MTLKTTKLRDAIALALAMGATTLMGTGAAFAQETQATAADAPDSDQTEPQTAKAKDEAKELDRIIVTGTRIQSQTITASSPVAEIDKETFKNTGATRADDLVNQYPQMSPYFDNFANNGAYGYPVLDLRGLGPDRTLTLVDGHRLPPGAFQARDISLVPTAAIKRVDILTGGASAVYGADAVAGVVNFVLDTDFEGFSVNVGTSAYQHDNRNEYIRPKLDARGFTYPDGNSGFDGSATNLDLVVGGSFGDGSGHAMAWLTWRENAALLQGDRDYSSCALSSSGTSCGGSGTAPAPNFFLLDNSFNYVDYAHLNADGSWAPGIGERYNYAPINYYQRPDSRWNFGTSLKYEVSERFRPYINTMFVNKKSTTQIAESGTFFANTLMLDCTDPLVGTMCADLGLDPSGPVTVYVGKRNVEGGPRIFDDQTTSYRVVAGAEGDLSPTWTYDASVTYGHYSNSNTSINDFLADRVGDALLGCPSGSFGGCIPYDVWTPGGVTADAAAALQGVGLQNVDTSMLVLNGYVSGDTGFGFSSAGGENVKLVAGFEYRKEEYDRVTDSNTASGNFTGSGGPTPSLAGSITVHELFLESAVPLIKDMGAIDSLNLDLGYRLSDYDNSGRADTYKLGFNSQFLDHYRLRGGFNHAIRGPNVAELFSAQNISLWSGDDPCAGATPEFTAAQCANSGVTAGQYGNVPSSPASQYNQFSGGNPDLAPESADTWTLGFAATPFRGLEFSVDYFDIQMTDRVAAIGASTILRFCGITGDPFLCDRVQRNANTGDLWLGSDPTTSGYVVNTLDNFGDSHTRGVDLSAKYRWDMLGGRAWASFIGSRVLEQEIAPLPGVNEDATYDCVGKINISCQTPKWRHIANLGYGRDWYSLNLRWRYTGAMDYVESDGTPATTDQILVNNDNKLDAVNYFDLSGTFYFGSLTELTLGVNNIADKEPPMVGATLALNGNAPGGYDQAGRYFFGSVTFRF